MGFKKILIISIVLSIAQIVLGELWEFGISNTPGSVVISHNEGYIGLLTRTKKIHLEVPQCYIITYVKVEVHNLISSPKVRYNLAKNTVTIAYGLLQNSISTYDIVAKAVWKQGCIVAPAPNDDMK